MKMTLPWCLNIAGLVVGMIAALLMFYFPPRIEMITDKGETFVNFVASPTDEGKRKVQRQTAFSKAAPMILGLSFLLQVWAAWLEVLK